MKNDQRKSRVELHRTDIGCVEMTLEELRCNVDKLIQRFGGKAWFEYLDMEYLCYKAMETEEQMEARLREEKDAKSKRLKAAKAQVAALEKELKGEE